METSVYNAIPWVPDTNEFLFQFTKAIAGYFVFRWICKWRLINFKGKAQTNPNI